MSEIIQSNESGVLQYAYLRQNIERILSKLPEDEQHAEGLSKALRRQVGSLLPDGESEAFNHFLNKVVTLDQKALIDDTAAL